MNPESEDFLGELRLGKRLITVGHVAARDKRVERRVVGALEDGRWTGGRVFVDVQAGGVGHACIDANCPTVCQVQLIFICYSVTQLTRC